MMELHDELEVENNTLESGGALVMLKDQDKVCK